MSKSFTSLHVEVKEWTPPERLADSVNNADGSPWILLHSQGSHPCGARYSILGAQPVLTLESFASRILIRDTATGSSSLLYGNPWRSMEALWRRFELPEDSPWPTGAMMGIWGYDLKQFTAPKSARRSWRDLTVPDCWIGVFSSLAVFDHENHHIHLISAGLKADGTRSIQIAQREIQNWEGLIEKTAQDQSESQSPYPENVSARLKTKKVNLEPRTQSNLSRSAWIQKVLKAKEYIRAGDIYQINLSHRIRSRAPENPWDFAKDFFKLSPAPYAGYLQTGSIQIASSSPELFLQTDGKTIRSTPIKGTRPRGSSPETDLLLENELRDSSKERAELVMITDLIRNDLGRICEYGSIRVPDLLRLEKYAQVQHLISTVEGELKSGMDPLKAFELCFPGGSITGAPKIRAMEIIEELEPLGRGPYTGSLGYLGLNGQSAWNILIRSAVFHERQVYFNTGAGIVYDSDPEMEYEETRDKAAGFLKTLNFYRDERVERRNN